MRQPHVLMPMALLLCGLLVASDVWAEAVGSPASILKKGKWVMGASGGAVPSRTLHGDAEARLYHGGHARGYGLTDWLSIYGKIGVAHLEVDDPAIIKPNNTSSTNSFGFNLFTEAQVKARLWRHARTGFEWDGSIQYVDIRAGHKDKTEGRWHEWQFARRSSVGLAKIICDQCSNASYSF